MWNHNCGDKGAASNSSPHCFWKISNVDGGSIQPTPILPGGIFTCNKTNTTSIGAISVDGVIRELLCHHHPQLEKHAHAIVFLIRHQVATPEWMQLTTLSIIAGQKADKNNVYHYFFNVVGGCLLSFVAKRHSLTTSWTYWELYIWACCS